MKAIVTGSRTHMDDTLIRGVLAEWGVTILLHGGAPGADAIADLWARDNDVETRTFPADWERHGKRAGYLRNKAMADAGADVCLAFPLGESRGTHMMMELAETAGIPVHSYVPLGGAS